MCSREKIQQRSLIVSYGLVINRPHKPCVPTGLACALGESAGGEAAGEAGEGLVYMERQRGKCMIVLGRAREVLRGAGARVWVCQGCQGSLRVLSFGEGVAGD